MIIPFFDARIDAPHVDLRSDGGILRMVAVNLNTAAKTGEFSARRAEKLMHAKADDGARWLELVGLGR
jgi:hypothetical protein